MKTRAVALALPALLAAACGADYTAVAMAVQRVLARSRRDKSLRDAMRRLANKCEK